MSKMPDSCKPNCQYDTKVNFSYAFGTPHRITIARPESSDKTLLDLETGKLDMFWSTHNLKNELLCVYNPQNADWNITIIPNIDGNNYRCSTWHRLEQDIPILDNLYFDSRGTVRLEAAAGSSAAVIRVTVSNTGERIHTFGVQLCTEKEGLYVPACMDSQSDRDVILAGYWDRADRVVVFGLGSDEIKCEYPAIINMFWTINAGESLTAWIIRPYEAYEADLPELKQHNWGKDFEDAKNEWRTLLNRAVKIEIPDQGVYKAFNACIGDLFIMREPLMGGYIGGTPGTQKYRSINAGEGPLAAVVLDKAGFHKEALDGLRVHMDFQESDGNWNDHKGWMHHMWCGSGFKAWAAVEHYKLTGDLKFLNAVYPRLIASSRWNEMQRARTRKLENGQRTAVYGLMPPGMGDCGLYDDNSIFGVFIPHNMMSVYGDRLTLEAAEILGKSEDLQELNIIYKRAFEDLLTAIDKGAIAEDGYRWIPGTPNKTSGSRWGAIYALYPCCLLPAEHELITGTFKYIEKNLSPGGQPMNTGWMKNGTWVATSLDNLAEAHLAQENGDAAVQYLYSALNHGTPLYTWCEERGIEPGTKECSGDRQHAWTPIAVVRAIRDSLVMEFGKGLHLALGTARGWLASGCPVGISNASTYFGPVSYKIQYDSYNSRITGKVKFPEESEMEMATLHIRMPQGFYIKEVSNSTGALITDKGNEIMWKFPKGEYDVECLISADTLKTISK